MKKIFLALTLMIAMSSLHAINLGVWGEVYPIVEPDFLTFIHERLDLMQQNGQINAMNQVFKDAVVKHVLRPTSVSGLGVATEEKIHYFDPTITLSEDIVDDEGHLIAAKGIRINPLSKINFNESLIFIDGDDASELTFAEDAADFYQHQGKLTKIILVNGDMREVAKKLGRIYFDQSGILTHKFGIESVPAIVTEDHLKLKIDEYPDNIAFKTSSTKEESTRSNDHVH